MTRILKSPAKYVQGPGVLAALDRYLQGMGERFLVLISPKGMTRMGDALRTSFDGKPYEPTYELFEGECSQARIDRLAALGRERRCTAVIGIGGGKILDAAKAAAYTLDVPVVIIPTVASTDSPCSSLSVIYREDGTFDRYLRLDACPEIVLVDTEVIAKAPASLLAAGMGDAMSTWFEARACRASGSANQVGGQPTHAAAGLAEQCWTLLRQYGPQAMRDMEAHTCSEAVETIVEVNTYLSGVGFESGGLAAAHAIQKGFTLIPQLRAQPHGCLVAFCTLVQLVMEQAEEELDAALGFCRDVGLPVCFADMGYAEVEPSALRQVAETVCAPSSTVHAMPFPVTAQSLYDALLRADAEGRAFRETDRLK